MSKAKILFDAEPLVGNKKTGVGYYTEHLIKGLLNHGAYNYVLHGYFFNFLNRKPKPLANSRTIGFSEVLFPGKVLTLCRRFGFQPFLEFFTPKQSDIVLFTNYVSLPLLRKRKTALVVYDLGFMDHPEFTQERNLQFLQKFCPPSIQQADLIITISEFTKERLLHYFPNLKAKIIVTPIPPSQESVTPQRLGKRLEGAGIEKGHYILYLGTIEPRKNLQALAQAYRLLPQSLRGAYSLVLAGGKGWKDEGILSAIADLQAKGANIIMPGYISDEEKAALYSNAACFVLPSHYEGFGMPVLEAMQYGTPVALSDIPVFHEVAGGAAAYFDKDNPEDISAVLAELLTNKALRERLRARGAKQLKTFSWQTNAELVIHAFGEVLK